MNDFFNNQDNMNNNYGRDHGQNDGEYYCSYIPNNTALQKKRAGKYIFVAVTAVMLALLVVFSGMLVYTLTVRTYLLSKQKETLRLGDGTDFPNKTDIHGEADCGLCHGISAIDVNSDNLFYYYRYGIKDRGVIVTESVYEDKLVFGDRIVSVNGMEISVTSDIQRALDGCKVGDTVEIVASRSGKTFTVSVTLREQVPDYVDFG